jgi:hypothetical protein
MTIRLCLAALFTLLGVGLSVPPVSAQTNPGNATAAPKPAPRPQSSRAPLPRPPVAAPQSDPEPTSPATPEELRAAERVFYGTYHCEDNQTVLVSTMPKYPGYVVLKHNAREYNMRASESPTGAILLEGINGETKVVQIANKSMLLNVKTGQRILDGCVSEEQRKKTESDKASGGTTAPSTR